MNMGRVLSSPLAAAWVIVGVLGMGAGNVTLAADLAPANAAREVDQLLLAEALTDSGASIAPAADDETFLRRLSLDVVGELPTPGEITAFALSPSPDKRQASIDRLVAEERFGRNWARYWRDVILYRRAEDRALLSAAAAESFLTEAFNEGTPWDEITTAFLTATGDVRENGATALVMAQMGQPAELAAETARIFLGVQIQCAQCHDHPTESWKREQFHELAAFFPRTVVRPVRDPETGRQRGFEVVSADGRFMRFGPNGRTPEHYMPDLEHPEESGMMMTPTFFVSGQAFRMGTPDLARRETLARWITSPDNPWFAKAFVNRMWAELVGRAFYEPVDDLGPDRECFAPETIDYLAAAFTESGYDVKWLVRTIAATDAYARASRHSDDPSETPFIANCPQRLRSDQVFDALKAAVGLSEGFTSFRGRPQGGGAYPGARGNVRLQFQQDFGYDPSDPRDEVAGSIPQALTLMNSPIVNRGINGRTRTTGLGRLLADTEDDEQVTVELYLRCMARQPGDDELRECLAHVRRTRDRAEAFEDILWALVNSTEFLYRQ